jgi:hypothetical protein
MKVHFSVRICNRAAEYALEIHSLRPSQENAYVRIKVLVYFFDCRGIAYREIVLPDQVVRYYYRSILCYYQ